MAHVLAAREINELAIIRYEGKKNTYVNSSGINVISNIPCEI